MSTDAETDAKEIAKIYLKGRFFWDFLSVIPFKKLFPDMDLMYSKLFYLNKLSRLYNGFVLLNYKLYVRELIDFITINIMKVIEEDHEKANGQDLDFVKILTVIRAKNVFHATETIIFLLTVSFLVG